MEKGNGGKEWQNEGQKKKKVSGEGSISPEAGEKSKSEKKLAKRGTVKRVGPMLKRLSKEKCQGRK